MWSKTTQNQNRGSQIDSLAHQRRNHMFFSIISPTHHLSPTELTNSGFKKITKSIKRIGPIIWSTQHIKIKIKATKILADPGYKYLPEKAVDKAKSLSGQAK